MSKLFTMLIEYKSGNVVLIPSVQGKSHSIATEETKHLLYEMGNRLLNENVINGYQIVEMVTPVIRIPN